MVRGVEGKLEGLEGVLQFLWALTIRFAEGAVEREHPKTHVCSRVLDPELCLPPRNTLVVIDIGPQLHRCSLNA